MIRRILLRVINPWVWRNAESTARKLREFAAAETGSKLDLILASAQTNSPQRSALYLRHALDESRHATLFTDNARLLDADKDDHKVDIEALFQNLDEISFLAFVYLGEARGRRQFESYIHYFEKHQKHMERGLFDRIVKDERMHEAYTWKELVKLAGSESAANQHIRRMHFWEFRRNFLRTGRMISQTVYQLGMHAIYIISLPIALSVRILRPIKVGWRNETL